MSNVNTWSNTASSNNSAAPNGFPENMNYSDVNNSAREVMAAVAKWYSDTNGSITTGGSSDAYTITSNRGLGTYADGMIVVAKANHTNSGAATLNLDSGGVTAIVREDDTAMASGEIVQDHFYAFRYDSTLSKFIVFPFYSAGLEQWNSKTAPSGTVVGTTDSQTLTNKTMGDTTFSGALAETVYALSGTTPAIDPSNGTVQTWTLSGTSTPTDSLSAGEAVELWIDDGSAYAITWTHVDQWEGGAAPALATSGYTVVVLRKISTTLYGAIIGSFS